MSMKKSNDTIGNHTRDLPACSGVPLPTAPPCAYSLTVLEFKLQYLADLLHKLLIRLRVCDEGLSVGLFL